MGAHSFLWIAEFFGRLHPMIVHFPVALLVVVLFMEAFTLGGKRSNLREGITWLVYIGAASALLSVAAGLSLYFAEDYQGDLVYQHLLTGSLTAIFSIITLVLLQRFVSGKTKSLLHYRLVLTITVILITVAGHLGASLTHGEDFLSSTLPWNQTENQQDLAGDLLTEFSAVSKQSELSNDQLDRLNLEVRAIFAHNCYQCHSELKQKGELILETKAGVMKGGKSGPLFIRGDAEKSEIIRRLKLPREDKEAMPGKGKALSKEEIALISLWIEEGAHWADESLKIFPEAELALTKPELPAVNTTTNHPVDKIITAYFEEMDLEIPAVVDDRTFIRRAYLDVVGLLPEPEEVQEFEQNTTLDKRERLIRTLLTDETNYTQHWLSFWNDLLRNDYSGPGFITGGRKQITSWIYQSLLQNKPYNQMVKQLTNPTDESEGFIKGIQWRGVVNASQRTEMQAAQNISQSLLGINLKCASCHNSFVSNLTLNQAYGFANVFADSTLEIYRCDQPTGKMSEVKFLYPELGVVEAATIKERLKKLSEVMAKPENGRLYRTITNRIWDRLLGRGLVEPLDEMDNPPWNAGLLDWLASDFIENGYDLKHLIERIMTSRAYQLPTVKYDQVQDLKAANYVFKGPVRRRLSAEQFADAVSQVVAPVYYSVAYNPEEKDLQADWVWHREVEVERDVLPKPGKRYFRHEFELPSKTIKSAEALITVDHAFTLYVNGKQVANGNDWRKVNKISLENYLQSHENLIAVVGENEGPIPNPAGLLFSLRLTYEDGTRHFIHSDENWKTTDSMPAEGWTTLEYDDLAWEQVKKVGGSRARSYWGELINFTFDEQPQQFARASLVKLDPFMKALGRPTRENVATSRDDQATLLQALELTNGEFFNQVIEDGAENWLAAFRNDLPTMIHQLYLKSFGREPNQAEEKLMLDLLGTQPSTDQVQDLLWSVVLLPEFQFIY